MGEGFIVESSFTDNGICTPKEFTRDLHGNVEGIRQSRVGSHHYNGVAENEINNMFRISRKMIIHTVQMWNDVNEKRFWTMAMAHSVHLHYHNPHISSGLSPKEVWTSSKSYHSALHNSHPWVCPEYFLEPRLTYGKSYLNVCQDIGDLNI